MTSPHVSKQWPAKLHRKIDVYQISCGKLEYLHSTNAYENLGAACMGAALMNGTNGLKDGTAYKAFYAK